ncbi:hypothetical protein HYC85_012364 [Camellia sinensis]|uniref:CobW/HypB/UreG nucleotide-binding domain-containing protein n=1 Tax=Camellia sinensis TaxID=4442 RepID=A0A7J7HDS3_CAMSI|nr:hypothetical protein HYC85_012364 [Camellia sinensis]
MCSKESLQLQSVQVSESLFSRDDVSHVASSMWIDYRFIAIEYAYKYGEVDIDGSLVAAKAAGAEDIVMLNNGCLCCTVRGDLVRMIAELVDKKKGKFDHIVIETTGLANLAPIIQTFYAEDQIFNEVKLDGVVTLVDAKHADFHLDDVKPKGVVNEAVEQIVYADRIILNKTPFFTDGSLSAATTNTTQPPQIIRTVEHWSIHIFFVGFKLVAQFPAHLNINRMAHLKRTQFGKVDLDYVLGIGGFDLESAVNTEGSKEDHGSHDHEHEYDHEHHHHHDHKHEIGQKCKRFCEKRKKKLKARMDFRHKHIACRAEVGSLRNIKELDK